MSRANVKSTKPDEEKRVKKRVNDALAYIDQVPTAKIATVPREFGVTRQRLQHRLQGIPPKAGLPTANTKLSRVKDIALYRYIDRFNAINLTIRPAFIRDTANTIFKERAPTNTPGPPEVFRIYWTTRFIKRNNYSRVLQKRLRLIAKHEDINRVLPYFQQLQKTIKDNGIPPDNIWNMDETGFRIGIKKDQFVVTRRVRVHLFSTPENRESVIAIKAISAGGTALPAFLILTGKVRIEQWYQVPELDPNTKIVLSKSEYTNNEITFQWLQHFRNIPNQPVVNAY